ncbi:hypothetical protein TSAR_008083 [Trichomalopsis sarcophagae]|uniref:Uncharacterized protein n=1 Tax=Trichomalopsis sarcophagae TaxID=543379 RepID=A0A232FNK9_9HYME|nr:hypothetical protein TSAR_008083 [Trichomalopsis sarcophagae]
MKFPSVYERWWLRMTQERRAINKTMDVLNQAGKTPSSLSNVKKVATRFGMKIVLQLDSLFGVFLPTRVNALLVEKEEAYNNFKEDTEK